MMFVGGRRRSGVQESGLEWQMVMMRRRIIGIKGNEGVCWGWRGMKRERQVKRKSGPWCYELVELILCSIEHVGVCVCVCMLYLPFFLLGANTVNKHNLPAATFQNASNLTSLSCLRLSRRLSLHEKEKIAPDTLLGESELTGHPLNDSI